MRKKLTDFSIVAIIGSTKHANTNEEDIVDVVGDCVDQINSTQINFDNLKIVDRVSKISFQNNSTTTKKKHQITKTQFQGQNQKRARKYQCEYCELSLCNRGQLKSHVRSHTGERPFRCEHQFCGKTFTRNEELTRHKRIHTGQRPFACYLCAKRFGRKDHLKKHLKTHAKHGTIQLEELDKALNISKVVALPSQQQQQQIQSKYSPANTNIPLISDTSNHCSTFQQQAPSCQTQNATHWQNSSNTIISNVCHQLKNDNNNLNVNVTNTQNVNEAINGYLERIVRQFGCAPTASAAPLT